MTVFTLSPTNATGEPLEDAPNGVWYVLEGDYVHFKCTDPKQALAILENIKSTTIPPQKRCTEVQHEFYELGGARAEATSLFAKVTLRNMKWLMSQTLRTPLPDPAQQTPENLQKASSNDSQNNNPASSSSKNKI
ncbi:hypothetical protein [Pseudomonas sp. B7]|uniref:hypothetical protein n=1 Tax=Pseudomonas sp. B7 TaxID=360962 RepID=UPI00191D8ACC|nr:hypothetical protein [Pseudomonas sp. B7]MBL0793648.1 hypothetical protein [Pseudomonas sp. B7]